MIKIVPGADGEGWWLSYGGTFLEGGPYPTYEAAEAAKQEKEK